MNKNEKLEFAKRLREAMEAAGYEARPCVLEKHFNSRYWGRSVTFQAVRRWLCGDSIPEQDKLLVLAEWLNMEPQVLRYGAPAKRAVREKNNHKYWEAKLSTNEQQLFDTFLELAAVKQKLVRELIQALADADRE